MPITRHDGYFANGTGGGATVPPANETIAGVARASTQQAVNDGIDDTTFVTPLKLKNYSGAESIGSLIDCGTFTESVGVLVDCGTFN